MVNKNKIKKQVVVLAIASEARLVMRLCNLKLLSVVFGLIEEAVFWLDLNTTHRFKNII